jgi:hypothetical protein
LNLIAKTFYASTLGSALGMWVPTVAAQPTTDSSEAGPSHLDFLTWFPQHRLPTVVMFARFLPEVLQHPVLLLLLLLLLLLGPNELPNGEVDDAANSSCIRCGVADGC